MKLKILITGGTGLVGKALTSLLESQAYDVAYLSRTPLKSNRRSFYWNHEKGDIDSQAIEYADVIIHLAGENISNRKWTYNQKKRIISSRVQTTKLLERAIQSAFKKPRAFISASAIGYYGNVTSDHIFSEEDPSGTDFLAETVVKWEESVKQIHALGIPTAILRIGMVMSKQGGALPKMIQPIKWGLGAFIGSGNQWVPWIALEDLARMFLFVLEQKLLATPSKEYIIYNGVSEDNINNKELMRQIAKAIKRPFFSLHVPNFLFNLMFGEMATILLYGSRVSSKKINSEGFRFRYTKIPDLFENNMINR